MAGQNTLFQKLKSVAGLALIGLAIFMLHGNLTDATARLSRLAGISAEATQTFGELTAVGLAALQVWRSYLFDRQEFLRSLCRILISFWPLVLVITGAVFTEMASRTKSENIQNKIAGPVDRAALRSRRKWGQGPAGQHRRGSRLNPD
jgi:hypothetical protein